MNKDYLVNCIKMTSETNNLAFFPIKYNSLLNYYHLQSFLVWNAKDVDYSKDREDYLKLDKAEQDLCKKLLFLFAQLDGLVNENLIKHFKEETREKAKECGYFYAVQEFIEVVHNEVYSQLILAIITDIHERDVGLNSIHTIPAIKKIGDWAQTWMDSNISILKRLIAFACIEGMIFQSAFAGIYWFKRKNVLQGLTKANEWIARDETIHTLFGIELYKHYTEKWGYQALKQEEVEEIISSAIKVSDVFTEYAFAKNIKGITHEEMKNYVRLTADELCKNLGYKKIYNVENPFEWMNIIGLPNKTNFFESVVSEYSRNFDTKIDYDKIFSE